MPINKISRKDFEDGNFEVRHIEIKNHPVVIFLKENKDHAFIVNTIVKHTKMGKETVRSMLRTLKKKDLVTHKIPYFIWKKKVVKKKKVAKKKTKKKRR